MRDTHRIKEKYELSLDNRQIITLTMAALVVLGGAFILGVVVGKKLAVEQGALAPPTDLLSAVDQKTAALETMQQDASLTFQDELTRKATPEPRTPEPVKLADAKRPDEKKPPDAKIDPAPKPELVKPPDVKPPDETPDTEPKPAETRVAAASALPDAVKAEPVTTRTSDAGALKEAFGKAQKTEPETAANGSWTLQLAAYQDRAEADRFSAGLRDKGYAPYVVEASVPGKGQWFRVRMGRFATKDAAARYMTDFKRETSMDAIVAQ